MALDPRLFLRPGCKPDQQFKQNQAAQRKGFIDSLSSSVGDLELLNEAGLGEVGQGLRDLSSLSDQFRTGTAAGSAIASAIQSVDQGANAVFDKVGINPNAVTDTLSRINPNVANRALGQAQNVAEDVRQGNFSVDKIPQAAQDLQNAKNLIDGAFVEEPRQSQKNKELCTASPYARELIRYAPKHKFMFVVDIEFSPAYQNLFPYSNGTAFVVKRSTRPEVQWEYEEVNMYNFWTKVPKRTSFQPVTMTFYDDNKNYAQLFHTAYLRAMSPITNLKFDQRVQNITESYEDRSMDYNSELEDGMFSQSEPSTRGYAASLGPLNDNTKNVLNKIRLLHIFDYGRLVNVYHFFNPKIESFSPDELNMAESGDGNEMEFQFSYDSMYIEPGYSIKNGDGSIDIAQLTGADGRAEKYFIEPVFSDEPGDSHAAPDDSQESSMVTGENQIDPTTGENSSPTGLTVEELQRSADSSGGFSGIR